MRRPRRRAGSRSSSCCCRWRSRHGDGADPAAGPRSRSGSGSARSSGREARPRRRGARLADPGSPAGRVPRPGPAAAAARAGVARLRHLPRRGGPRRAFAPANRRLVTAWLDGGDLKYRIQAPLAPAGDGVGARQHAGARLGARGDALPGAGSAGEETPTRPRRRSWSALPARAAAAGARPRAAAAPARGWRRDAGRARQRPVPAVGGPLRADDARDDVADGRGRRPRAVDPALARARRLLRGRVGAGDDAWRSSRPGGRSRRRRSSPLAGPGRCRSGAGRTGVGVLARGLRWSRTCAMPTATPQRRSCSSTELRLPGSPLRGAGYPVVQVLVAATGGGSRQAIAAEVAPVTCAPRDRRGLDRRGAARALGRHPRRRRDLARRRQPRRQVRLSTAPSSRARRPGPGAPAPR